jgi:hypothetical protein
MTEAPLLLMARFGVATTLTQALLDDFVDHFKRNLRIKLQARHLQAILPLWGQKPFYFPQDNVLILMGTIASASVYQFEKLAMHDIIDAWKTVPANTITSGTISWGPPTDPRFLELKLLQMSQDLQQIKQLLHQVVGRLDSHDERLKKLEERTTKIEEKISV